MSAIEDDLTNMIIIADLMRKYSDNLMHEAKMNNLVNLGNRTKGLRDKCQWFITDVKSNLSSEEAREIDQNLKKTDPVGAYNVFEYALDLSDENRDKLIQLIRLLRDNKKVDITTKVIE